MTKDNNEPQLVTAVASVSGPNIRACLAGVRHKLGITLQESRERDRIPRGDGLWRVWLKNGMMVEVTIIKHSHVECDLDPTLRIV